MATYVSYPAVRKLQEYLEAHKSEIGFAKSLKDADGAFDGQYGPDTDEAFFAWMSKLPEGSDLTSLVPHVLSTDDYAQITQAQREFGVRQPSPKPNGGGVGPTPGASVPLPKGEEGWPSWKWLLLGAGVAAVGLVAYTVVKKGSAAPAPARAAAGMGCMCGDAGRRRG